MKKYSKSSGFYLAAKKTFFDDNADLLKKARMQNALYASQPLRRHCKICHAEIQGQADFKSHGVEYVFCDQCGHLNGKHEETEEFIDKLYIADSGSGYAKNYIDTSYVEKIRTVYAPKVDFLQSSLPEETISILDVGCGAGHFVGACLENGVSAYGIDVNETMVEHGNAQLEHYYNKSALKIGNESNFLKEVETTNSNVITAIGVIEHLRDPHLFFNAFKKSNAQYLYYSVPTFSFGFILENIFPNIFPRNLSGGHTHAFTVQSRQRMHDLLAADVVSEWYFGTDMMDLYRSTLISLKQSGASERMINVSSDALLPMVDPLQEIADEQHFCSEIHCVIKKT